MPSDNRQLLKQRFPAILAMLDTLPDDGSILPLTARNGDPTLRVSRGNAGRLIHSGYDPADEAVRFVNALTLSPGSLPVVIGAGCGYHIDALIDCRGPFDAMVIVEPDPALFKKALAVRDFSRILSQPQLRLIVESDHNVLMKSLGAILQCDELKPRLKLIIHQPSLDVYRQSGSPFIDILDKLHLGPRLQAMMRENCMINLPHILRSPGINKLFDAFTGVPALLVSAGPSLSYDLPLLNDAPRNRLLFSVTTIFDLLLSGGVRPDLAFIGDPKKIMETHFENRWDEDVPLLFIPSASSAVIGRYAGPKIVALQNEFRFSDIISEKADKGRVDVGESVATLMLDAAIRMGCDPIVFVGQDLAFSDGHSHTDGVEKRLKVDRAGCTVESVDGRLIPTSSVLLWFKRWIENRIAREPGRTFINVSRTGARINGTLEMPLCEVMSRYAAMPVDKSPLSNLFR